jgi:hypothetical protein
VDAAQPDFVCNLHKSIYGLKKAPRAWFHCLSTALLEFSFTVSMVNHSIFSSSMVKSLSSCWYIYVDDIIVTKNTISVVQSFILKLQQQFPLKDLGDSGFFLGIQVALSPAHLHLSQAKYIADLLHHTCMLGAKPSVSPYFSSASCLTLMENPLLILLNITRW